MAYCSSFDSRQDAMARFRRWVSELQMSSTSNAGGGFSARREDLKSNSRTVEIAA
jgi:hypothetical protein